MTEVIRHNFALQDSVQRVIIKFRSRGYTVTTVVFANGVARRKSDQLRSITKYLLPARETSRSLYEKNAFES